MTTIKRTNGFKVARFTIAWACAAGLLLSLFPSIANAGPCGNGNINGGEQCDGTNLNSKTCVTQGFAGGTLTCTASCTFNTTGCTNCGNATIQAGEQCDGTNLNSATCITRGYVGGSLSCSSTCTFNESACSNCGNGTVNAGESCDGTALAGATCVTQGFGGGTLACNSSCQYDTSSCTSACGNGAIDASEQCDGTDLNSETCVTQGFGGGALACTAGCAFDTSACTSACGNGTIDVGEQCDGTALNSETCVTRGYTAGALACNSSCTFDVSACSGGGLPTNFAAGALIIPMDQCYQFMNGNSGQPSYCVDPSSSGDVIKAYGLVWLLMKNGITIQWIIDSDKTGATGCVGTESSDGQIDGRDFCVSSGAGDPATVYDRSTQSFVDFTSATNIPYRGGSFVIPASDAAAALALIQTGSIPTDFGHTIASTFNDVTIHRAEVPFSAPIYRTMTGSPPRVAVLEGSSGKDSTQFLGFAGLGFNGAEGTPSAPGSVYDYITSTEIGSSQLSSQGYRVLWLSDYEYQSGDATAFEKIASFVDAGRGLMAMCAGIAAFETSYKGNNGNLDGPGCMDDAACAAATNTRFMTPQGISANKLATSATLYFSDVGSPFAQKANLNMQAQGGHVSDFKPATSNAVGSDTAYNTGVDRLVTSDLAGTGSELVAFHYKDNDSTKGPILYIGGHNYPGGHVGMQRIVLNTLFGMDGLVNITDDELSRSSPLLVEGSAEAVIYQGTFQVPASTTNSIFDATDPTAWTFPLYTGHLRAYDLTKLTTAQTNFEDIYGILWDGSYNVPSDSGSNGGFPSARSVYTASLQTVSYNTYLSLVDFTITNAATLGGSLGQSAVTDSKVGDAYSSNAEAIIGRIRAGGLGGIDKSTPAFVPPNARFASRVAAIYAASLGGMLHAFKTKDIPAGDTLAWTDSSLKEIWGFIPPNQLGLLSANSAQLQASPAVADLFGDFLGSGSVPGTDGTREWVTFLSLPASSASGNAVYALDITDPATMKPLWASSPSNIGSAYGTSIGVISCNRTPRSTVFVATNDGAVSGHGLRVFALDATTGEQIWTFSRTYTRTIPSSTSIPNTTPSTPAAVDKLGTVGCQTHLYIGDMEGKVWELKADTGESTTGTTPLWDAETGATAANYPIGAPVALFRDTNRQLNIVVATGGTDWAPASTVQQKLVVLNVSGTTPVTKLTHTFTAGERVYAAPTVVGNEVYILTSFGLADSISSYSSASDAGNAYRINMSSGSVLDLGATGMSYSSAGVGASGKIVTTSAQGSSVQDNPNADGTGTSLESPYGPLLSRLRLWLHNLK